MRISLTLRGLYEQQWCTLTEPTINLAQTYTRRRVLQNVPGHPSQTHTNTHLVADGTDVIVLLELLVRSCRQALDLVDSISAEQETLPAQLGPQPHVIVRMDEYDGGAHHGPLPKHRLRHRTPPRTPPPGTPAACRCRSPSRWHHPCSPPEPCAAPPPWRARRSAACPAPESQRV